MKKTGAGIIAALCCFVGAIAIWVVAYFELPNDVTHRDLAKNPPIATSVDTEPTSGQSGSSGGSGGSSESSGTGGSSSSSQPTFYALGSAPKTLDLNLESGTSNANQGLNFNGYYNGNLVITVPENWTIDMNYKNEDSMMPHSVGITTWADRQAMSFVPAFTGSIPKNFSMGITKGNPPMTFTVDANKAGKYAIVCGLPGHASGGMWVELDVSATATAPTIKTPSGTTTVGAGSGSASGSTAASGASSSQNTFVALGSGAKTVDLNLESGVSQANQGLNFNGYYNGNLVITVPLNWTIDMNYTNQDSMMPHSVGITTWADRQAMSFVPAFTGSIPKNFSMGITKGNPPMTFSVDANKAGQYAIVCGLPGHATGGMWVELDVSATATAPTVKTPSGTTTVTA